jgi:hypothetical protein
MLITTIVLLGVLLVGSIAGNVFLFQAAERYRLLNDYSESRIVEIQQLSKKVYEDIKELDNKEMFRKDDEVGVVFQDMVSIIKWYNDVVQEVNEEYNPELEPLEPIVSKG